MNSWIFLVMCSLTAHQREDIDFILMYAQYKADQVSHKITHIQYENELQEQYLKGKSDAYTDIVTQIERIRKIYKSSDYFGD